MSFFREFKTFAMRGNVVDLAVGIVIGAAFGKIVSSLVDGIIMPVIGLVVGGVNFAHLAVTLKPATIGPDGKEIAPVLLKYGAFIQTIVDFTIIAFAIFLVVKLMNSLKKQEAPPPPPGPSDEVKLLTEIRNALTTGRP